MLEYLLDKGADVESASANGYTALVWAARYGRTEAAERLIEAGVDANFKDKDGWNALSTAVHEGHLKIVQAIIKAGADLEAVENEGYTALMWAAEEGRLDIIGALLSAGAKLDVQNNRGGSALMWAIYEKKTDAAALLVKAGANTNLQNDQGLTALLMAAGTGDVASVKMFLRIKGQNRPNVNAADKTGSTPLHAACQNRHADVVKLLLRNGARTNVKDGRGFTPLIVSALNENGRITELLLATGNHDIDARGKMGNSALMTAAQEGAYSCEPKEVWFWGVCCSFFVLFVFDGTIALPERGFFSSIQALVTTVSLAAVTVCVPHPRTSVLFGWSCLLVPLYADARTAVDGRTHALEIGHINVVNALLAYKTKPSLEFVDKENGFTALASAAYFAFDGEEYVKTAKALVKAGASCVNPTTKGWTAIELAESRAPDGKTSEFVAWMKKHCLSSKELIKQAAAAKQAKKDEL